MVFDMANSASSLWGLRVLIVDNDPDSQFLLTTLFTCHGAEVLNTDSAEAALALLEQTQPDLLISEIHLPDEDGYSFICKVKALERERHIKIPAIALTVLTRPSDREHALTAGFRWHLPKPVDIDRLIAIATHFTCPLQLLPV